MYSHNNHEIWIAIRIQRGFVTDVKAYLNQSAADRIERRWRQDMNPDYDETNVSMVIVNPGRCDTSSI